ncbi:MAG: ABC transporter ATP-binding protein [Sphingomonas sp.]|jgi:iron complex transport system ATP-binding protein|uniref:ABC transporter ATP-binding protein n=1 Tax=Sphingomonas sp. TaxID=28214 RepID=UPI00356451EB
MELRIAKVCVALGGRHVLDSVSAVLRPGRITAILGPNGAGKSSLIRTTAGLVAPHVGTIMLDSRDVAHIDPRERARLIGYLPQDGVAAWNIRAAELVALGRLPHRAPFAGPSPHDFDAVMVAMAATETTHLADRPVGELSGGERARVLLARVLAGEPRWLLVDEPLTSLDPAHQLDILDRLRTVADGGAGVVIVLHDLGHAASVADDVLLLKNGHIAAFGEVREILTEQRVAEVFEVKVRWIETDDGQMLVPVGRV